MAAVEYRDAREGEVAEAAALFLETVEDLYRRQNITAPPPPLAYVEQVYGYIRRTGIFQVALSEGKLAAICHAVVRGRTWFLSGFWTLPALQGRKIGRPLLQRVWDEGSRAGAKIFFTWSSTETRAMATYMRMGMLPGYQTLTFAGPLAELPAGAEGYEVAPLEVGAAAAVDEVVRAASRETDHKFWLTEQRAEGRQLLRGGVVVGYYYFNRGTVGPAAWLEDVDAGALLAAACRDAAGAAGATGVSDVRLMVPGINHSAVRFALGAGLKLTTYSHLLTTEPFGRMENYLSSGPSLF